MATKAHTESGFALLMTLIVVGVILSVGISILDLTIKQVRLASDAKDSEVAFHAANAGMECARYWRRVESAAMEVGDQIDTECFGVNDNNVNGSSLSTSLDGEAYLYEFEYSWGTAAEPRCTQVSTIVASSSAISAGTMIEDVPDAIPGYPNTEPDYPDKFCDAGARCTIISVRGYNKSCGAVGSPATIQRDVLLQF